MLPDDRLPAGLAGLLQACRCCFSARSYPVFVLLVVGAITQVGPATVTGILLGAGASRLVGHDRVHRFFSTHRWSADELGLAVLRIVLARLLPPGAPIVLAVDDTLFRRRGKKVAFSFFGRDASLPGRAIVRGNRWVVAGIVVHLPVCTRPVCLPVLFRIWRGKGTDSCVQLARDLADLVLCAFPDRAVHLVGDAAYRGGALKHLPERATLTTRTISTSVLYDLAPPPTGKRGRPRTTGDRLGRPEQVLADVREHQVAVVRYGRTVTVAVKERLCLWHGTFGTRTGRLIAVREMKPGRPVLYLYTTDLTATVQQIVERYAARWGIEVAIENAKQLMGAGQARNRVPAAVERTVPFTLIVMTLVHLWYTLHGHAPADVTAHRTRRPWYTTKTEPAFSDMLAKARRALITARFSPHHPAHSPTPEIDPDLVAWAPTTA